MNNNIGTSNSFNYNNNVNTIQNDVPVETLNDNSNKGNKKRILKRLIYIFLIIIIISLCGLFIFKETVLLNKVNVVKNSITQLFNILETNIDNLNNVIIPFDLNEESLGIDGSIKLSSNYKDDDIDLSRLNDYLIKYNSALDLKNNKLSASFNLNKNNDTLLSLNTYIKGKYGAIESKQLSYYAYNYNTGRDIKELNINNKDVYNNIKSIINRTKDNVLSRIEENDITKDSADVTINGNTSSYIRYTYKINVNDYINNILKYYITDSSVLNMFSQIANTDSTTVKNTIQKIIDNNNINETLNYEIYLDGLFGNFKQIKIYNDNNPDFYFRIYLPNNNYEFELVDNNEVLASGKYQDNKISIDYNNFNSEIEKINNNEYKFSFKITNDQVDMMFDVNLISKVENDKQNIKLNIKNNNKLLTNNKDFDINMDIDISIYKKAIVKSISSFITKDISTIDENEENEIIIKYQKIVEEIIKDIYNKDINIDNSLNTILNNKS